ncbi:MAG: Maf family protein [Lachnospiraceae bacterium]|nr:Maf family protein [Lachnospiraceae bacterium]
MKTYLASASPRRREIIEKLGIKADIRVSGADEETDILDPEALVTELSKKKAVSVSADIHKAQDDDQPYCVIGADTVVSIDGMILGKPKDEQDAADMLSRLSGRTHQVFTGVTIVICKPGQNEDTISFCEKTDVDFCEMTKDEIDAYIATGDPMDKAGAYGVQSLAAPYVSGIKGDYYNVMGLPACRLYHELKKQGCI